MSVDEIPTPALIVDVDRIERNIEDFHRLIEGRGARLRSHIKTHKVPEIARAQIDAGSCGIAAAKPSEAQTFHDAGLEDIVIAFPSVGPDKWELIASMARTATVTANIDSEHQAHGLSAAAQALDTTIRAQIEIDTGFHRVGLPVDDVEAIAEFARFVARRPGLAFDGITTFRGKPSRLASMSAEEAGREEGELMVALAERLRGRGIAVREVTAGGTITSPSVAAVSGITEVRAGTYVFYDAMSVAHGVAQPDQVALTILATVVSRRRSGWATIDAGTKTFSGDRGMVAPGTGGDDIVAPAVGVDAAVIWTTEEHGMVRLGEGTSVEVGQRVAFMPYHVCTAVNLSDELIGVRAGTVERIWPVRARGCRT
jgi:D-serine deaminase-like pyridoxal phosphate-dependent protein